GTTGGDGCSASCQEEAGWACTGAPSACDPICNDGIVIAGDEACDDGNAVETDGCTTQCQSGVVCGITNVSLAGGDRFATDPATGTCYVSFDDDAATFGGAQTACIASGGHLAAITSAGEQTLVASVQNTAQNPWIGGTDALVEGSFGWLTGEAFSFNGFAAGQPDGGDGEDCLSLFSAAIAPAGQTGRWNDTNCDFTGFVQGRICELPAETCGDGFLQTSRGEQCDDDNTTAGDGCSASCRFEVFFSEYIEGSASNKAIELYNPFSVPVSLAGCSLRLYSNGAATPSFTLNLTQTIAANDVLVACNSSSNATILAACDIKNSSLIAFNGDDAIELVCGGKVVDSIGQIGLDPGIQWGTSTTPTSPSTLDRTLRRKCSVTSGDTVTSDAFDPAVQWGGFAIDTLTNLGVYGCVP
ncbi:MAG: DUF4215 domain-containing protein, partial [Deltaproteobacteria bacterium]|nr:DUF4215 domain-containing protein [Deltaproteobacteria bacterium]